jgi:hypothetical protein
MDWLSTGYITRKEFLTVEATPDTYVKSFMDPHPLQCGARSANCRWQQRLTAPLSRWVACISGNGLLGSAPKHIVTPSSWHYDLQQFGDAPRETIYVATVG